MTTLLPAFAQPHALHDAIKADASAFARLKFVGYQEVEGFGDEPPDVMEVRDCSGGSTLYVSIGAPIVARLERARREGDIVMIARCHAALRGDHLAVASFFSALEGAPGGAQ
jgi:hypothetical protein